MKKIACQLGIMSWLYIQYIFNDEKLYLFESPDFSTLWFQHDQMDWNEKFNSIVKETEENLAKAKVKIQFWIFWHIIADNYGSYA